jgi:hypothetical protein
MLADLLCREMCEKLELVYPGRIPDDSQASRIRLATFTEAFRSPRTRWPKGQIAIFRMRIMRISQGALTTVSGMSKRVIVGWVAYANPPGRKTSAFEGANVTFFGPAICYAATSICPLGPSVVQRLRHLPEYEPHSTISGEPAMAPLPLSSK